jgi:hypothetical protein
VAPREIEQTVRLVLNQGPRRPSAVVSEVMQRAGLTGKKQIREALRSLVDAGSVQVTTMGDLRLRNEG